jgi:hypothetical protein
MPPMQPLLLLPLRPRCMSHSDLFQAVTQRTKLFKEAKIPHFLQVSTGDVKQPKKLAIGDFGIVWTENGLMVAQGLALATQIYLRN